MNSQRRRLSRIGAAASLLAIVLLGGALRLYRLDAESADGNESFSILVSRLPMAQMTARLVDDIVHPPLYQYVLHWWFGVLGSTVFQARLLSAIFGIGAVWAIYWLGAVMLGRRTGLIAALLLAVSQLAVLYAQESRLYSMLLFLNILTLLLFWIAIRRRAALWWLGFLLAAAMLIQTHIVTGLTIAVLLGYSLLVRPRPVPLKWLALGVGFLAISLGPWLTTGVVQRALHSPQARLQSQSPRFEVSGTTLFRDVNRFNDGSWNGPDVAGPSWSFVVGALLFCVPAGLSLRRTLNSRGRARNAGGLVAALWIVPAIALLLLGALGMPYHIRDLVFCLAPYYILVAHGITLLPVRFRPAHLALTAMYGLGSVLALYTMQTKGDYRDVLAGLAHRYRAGDICFFTPSGEVPLQWNVYYGERPLDVATGADLEKRAADAPRVWVVDLGDESTQGILPRIAVTHPRSRVASFYKVSLRLYEHAVPAIASDAFAEDYWMYVGGSTSRGGLGIYRFKYHAATGRVEPAGVASGRIWESGPPGIDAQIRTLWPNVKRIVLGERNPAFFALHPNGSYLYSADNNPDGAITAFQIDHATGALKMLNRMPSHGGHPCYLAFDGTGRNLLVANFDGAIAVLPIDDSGRLHDAACIIHTEGPGTAGNGQPHPHSINPSPDNRFVIATDMGLDEVLVYRFDATSGTLTPADPPYLKTPAHSGARHFCFHPNGRFAYVIEEQGSSIMALAWDAVRGAFSPIGTTGTLPANSKGISVTAAVLVHPSGKFVYGSNRGNDSIAVFTVDPDRGALTPIECVSSQGRRPEGLSIDPTGNYMFAADQYSGTVVQFRIDSQTGRLTPTGAKFEAGSPTCIRFVPAT